MPTNFTLKNVSNCNFFWTCVHHYLAYARFEYAAIASQELIAPENSIVIGRYDWELPMRIQNRWRWFASMPLVRNNWIISIVSPSSTIDDCYYHNFSSSFWCIHQLYGIWFEWWKVDHKWSTIAIMHTIYLCMRNSKYFNRMQATLRRLDAFVGESEQMEIIVMVNAEHLFVSVERIGKLRFIDIENGNKIKYVRCAESVQCIHCASCGCSTTNWYWYSQETIKYCVCVCACVASFLASIVIGQWSPSPIQNPAVSFTKCAQF